MKVYKNFYRDRRSGLVWPTVWLSRETADFDLLNTKRYDKNREPLFRVVGEHPDERHLSRAGRDRRRSP